MIKMKTIMWFGFVLGALCAAGKVIITKQGHKTTIQCEVSSFNNLVWNHGNNLIIKVNGRTGFVVKGTSDITGRSMLKQGKNLEILRVKEEDAGEYTCVADGTSQQHTLLVVSVSASPPSDLQLGSEATLQCQVKGLDPSSTVQWMRPDGSPHAGSQTVHLKPVAHSDAGSWECTFSLGGERYKESLEIKVQEPKTSAPVISQDSKDTIKPTCPNCVTAPPSNTALLLELSWWVWVAIGVGCLVVVLLIVFVIVLCQRIKRRKRKLQKMKYDRQLLKSKPYCQCNCPAAGAKPQQGRRREKPSALPLQPLLME